MTTAAVDRLLALLVVALAGSGLATLRAGTPDDGWVYVTHGLLSGALVVAIIMKVRRSVPRAARTGRWGRLIVGLSVTVVAAAALSGGYLWVASGEILWLGSWTVLTLHAWLGLVLVPLVAAHLFPHRWRLLRPAHRPANGGRAVSRRAVLAGGVLGVAGIGGVALAGAVERLVGGERRFTGSRFLPSGGVPPATTFFGEGTPPVDPASWRVVIHGRVARPVTLDLAALRSLGETDVVAILDCTSGWAVETTWGGVRLAHVLDAAGALPLARRVVVRSATGWSTSLSIDEAHDALLATAVAGAALPVANGAPVRLVVPTRRGLDWVKWVSEVSVG